jgi:hypothetical protein
MGFYTAIKGIAKLTPLGVSIVQMMNASHETRWKEVSDALPQYEFLRSWAAFGRCDFIPYGTQCVSHAPNSMSQLSGDTWSFSCSLKNYDCEVEHFVSKVLPMMARYAEVMITNEGRYDESWQTTYVKGVMPQ